MSPRTLEREHGDPLFRNPPSVPGPSPAWLHPAPMETVPLPQGQEGKLRSGQGWAPTVRPAGEGARAGRSLTRADVQALAVLLQPLDPLLQLPLQGVVQQQLLTLQEAGVAQPGGGAGGLSAPPLLLPRRPSVTSRCCLAPCSSHSYLFRITSRQKPL